MVECGVCHLRYDVSARTNRDIRAGRVEARCVIHRKRRRRGTVTATMRRYWLDRFTIDQIEEMASALWPRPSQRGPIRDGEFLTAAADTRPLYVGDLPGSATRPP